jgi:N-acetylmuramic acid 6-phosphate (MurNAc-6-P) etherase
MTIVERESKIRRKDARRALKSSGNSVAVALVMLKTKVGRTQAQNALRAAGGNVRRAIALAEGE